MDDRIHQLLGLSAAVIVVVGYFEWRSLHSASAQQAVAAPATVPNPQLSQLMPFTAPIADTLRIGPASSDSITMPRDPFAAKPLPRLSEPSSAVAAAPRVKTDSLQWRVTTTLMAGSRRAALINDVLVYVGDPLPGGSKLTSVERDHVVVTDPKGAAHTVAVAKEGNG
jgi:hypothetical protein